MDEPARAGEDAQDGSFSPPFRPRSGALLGFGGTVLVLGTVGAIHRAGIWDPPELETAELARRMAQGLLGAENLGPESPLGLPTRGELGRGELPFTLIALGFRVFGLSAWAGRLPLALAGVLGAAALYWLMRRLGSARAGALALLVLGTAPLYFLHARTMLGDIVTMAAQSATMAGFALAIFERTSLRSRLLSLGIGLLGCAAGFGARGILVGVALPTLGVGIAWLLNALAGADRQRLRRVLGAAVLLGGVAAALVGSREFALAGPEKYSWLLGAYVSSSVSSTFDAVLRNLGHAFFPWSAVLPWAAGCLLNPVVVPAGGDAGAVRSLRLVLLTSSVVSFVGQSLVGAELGIVAFIAPSAVAGIVALALHDFDFDARQLLAFGLVVGALALVLLVDFQNFPDKVMLAYGLSDAVVPSAFAARSAPWVVAIGFTCAAAFFLFIQQPSGGVERAFRRDDYLAWPRALRALWGGNLLLGVLLVLGTLLALDLLRALAETVTALQRFGPTSELSRSLVRGGWIAIIVLLVSPLLLLLARDVSRVLLWPTRYSSVLARWVRPRELRFGRGAAAGVALSLCGVLASHVYYPALSSELSPKSTLEEYTRLARADDRLGVLGVDASSLRYHARASIEELATGERAIDWLVEAKHVASEPRRFLLLRKSELAWLNSAFRLHGTPRKNLPVLAGGSSEMLLAADRLLPGEVNRNPLASLVLEDAPRPSRPLDVDLASKLSVLGWDVLDARGETVDRVVPGVSYEFVIYHRVTERITGSWDTFIHVDGFHQRYNGDHPTLGGLYPLALLAPGDYIADRHRIELEPHYAPGTYNVYFGLYSGSRRLEVRRGPHEENRIIAGTLDVH